jgi:hypothetical protein
MKILIIFLLFFSISYSQKRDTIFYDGKKYKVEEVRLLYQDTIYYCKDINFRFAKDTIYVYKPRYYKKIKRNK